MIEKFYQFGAVLPDTLPVKSDLLQSDLVPYRFLTEFDQQVIRNNMLKTDIFFLCNSLAEINQFPQLGSFKSGKTVSVIFKIAKTGIKRYHRSFNL